MDQDRTDPPRRRLPTAWVVAAFVVLVLVVATLLITSRFDGEDDAPEQTDVGAPPLGAPGPPRVSRAG